MATFSRYTTSVYRFFCRNPTLKGYHRMNYTENYHLPQWDEHDRIMRSDFNRMCADIETGLTQSRASGETLNGRTLDRFCRMAYNHFQLVKNLNQIPAQTGIFYQDPAKDPSNVSGTMQWGGVCFAGSGVSGMNYEKFLELVQVRSQLKAVKDHPERGVPLDFTFRCPVAGVLNRFFLHGRFSNNTPGTPTPCRLTMTDLDTGSVVLSRSIDMAQAGSQGALVYTVNGPFFFHSGSGYRVRLEPLAAVYDMETMFVMDDQTPVYCYFNNSPASASHTFREAAASSGGLLILQCEVGGPKGRLTVTWDGKVLRPAAALPHQDRLGRRYHEYIYVHDGAVPATSTVALRFEDGGSGDFCFYDWGGILL